MAVIRATSFVHVARKTNSELLIKGEPGRRDIRVLRHEVSSIPCHGLPIFVMVNRMHKVLDDHMVETNDLSTLLPEAIEELDIFLTPTNKIFIPAACIGHELPIYGETMARQSRPDRELYTRSVVIQSERLWF